MTTMTMTTMTICNHRPKHEQRATVHMNNELAQQKNNKQRNKQTNKQSKRNKQQQQWQQWQQQAARAMT